MFNYCFFTVKHKVIRFALVYPIYIKCTILSTSWYSHQKLTFGQLFGKRHHCVAYRV